MTDNCTICVSSPDTAWDGSKSSSEDTCLLDAEWLNINGFEAEELVELEVPKYDIPVSPKIILLTKTAEDYTVISSKIVYRQK